MGYSVSDPDVQALVLGALLHDIGKVLQRAPSAREEESRITEEYAWFSPRHRPGVVHEKWSATFIRQHLPSYPRAETLALKHHAPEDSIERILALADHMAGGGREPTEDHGPAGAEPLVNILSQVRLVDSGWPSCMPTYLPLAPLSLSDTVLFPVNEKVEAVEAGYDPLVRWLHANMPPPDLPFSRLVERLLNITQIGLAHVPSAVHQTLPDVSLYDHQRITAALALALLAAHREGALESDALALPASDVLASDSPASTRPVVALIGGDVSGIQAFLYRVLSDGALRGLKGRSTYLQLLTHVVAQFVLDALGLLPCHLVYAAGGHFLILGSMSDAERLKEVQEQVDSRLLDMHKGAIGLTLAFEATSPADYRPNAFGAKWDALLGRVAQAKNHRFISLAPSRYETVFGPFGDGGEVSLCPSCGSEEVAGDGECPWCDSFGALGRQLAHVGRGYLAWRRRPPRVSTPRGWEEAIQQFGWELSIVATPEEARNADRIWSVSRFDTAVDGVLFLATHAPLEPDGRVREFQVLAEDADGYKRWGVLRSDVDNLGRVFREGLGENQSLDRYASLSGRLSLFFGLWADEIVRREAGDRTYTIYSGGDDLFIVGSWSVLPHVAKRIRSDFVRFSGGNPSLTLSAAIALPERVRSPLRVVALRAGELLDRQAKQYQREIRGRQRQKDALSFLHVPLDWDDELVSLNSLKEQLVALLDAGVPRALLQILYRASREHEEARRGERVERIWQLIYSLRRLEKAHPRHSQAIRKLEQELIGPLYGLREKIHVATRWAELVTRRN